MGKGYTSKPLSFNRRMVRASASVTREKNTVHSFSEVDVTIPRQLIREHFENTGEKLSFTAYLVTCLAQVIKQYPQFNAFTRRNRLVMLDDLTISVLVEREFMGEKVPEPMAIQQTQLKSYRQISDEIRSAQVHSGDSLRSLSGQTWIRFIPGFLLKAFVRIAEKNVTMAKRYGKVGVTAVGMFTAEPVWFIPHGSGTVLLTIGSIVKKEVWSGGRLEERERLHLTVSFDHNIVDGAPAARFLNQLIETIRCGKLIRLA